MSQNIVCWGSINQRFSIAMIYLNSFQLDLSLFYLQVSLIISLYYFSGQMTTQKGHYYQQGKRNQVYDRKEKESSQSSHSVTVEKSEDGQYYGKYFLNDSFKILHIDIVDTQQIYGNSSKNQTFMAYIIKVMTEDFSYQIKRRYSQFLKLYQSVLNIQNLRNKSLENGHVISNRNYQKLGKAEYTFPVKNISSSLLHFFNFSTKEKLALERKSGLSVFLNQIRTNYYKFPQQFTDDYILLLKFINMKEEHSKFWKRKDSRFNVHILKDSNQNTLKLLEKQGETNIQYLNQLLQHQMNKINLAAIKKQTVFKSNPIMVPYEIDYEIRNDPSVTDQIIKSVDCIRDIVLELKRKINFDHIRCILKGKDINQLQNAPLMKSRHGLIEYCLKHSLNDLVSMHIIRTVLFVLANSECNYSSDGFVKVLSEMDISAFSILGEKEKEIEENRQLRVLYFKLVKLYIHSKQLYCSQKKAWKEGEIPFGKIMTQFMVQKYKKWEEGADKNKQYKHKEDQKKWAMIIQNYPRVYCQKKTHQSCLVNDHKQRDSRFFQMINKKSLKNRIDEELENQFQIVQQDVNKQRRLGSNEKKNYQKTLKTEQAFVSLRTQKLQEFWLYKIQAEIGNRNYNYCLELMKKEQNWNQLLAHSQLDPYSNTRKDCYQIPGKQEKNFRFVQKEQIEMNLQQDQSDQEEELDHLESFIPITMGSQLIQEGDQEIKNQQKLKMSTQTMTSGSRSNAFQLQAQPVFKDTSQGLAHSRLSQKIVLIKEPPKSGEYFNSFYQKVVIQKKKKPVKSEQYCHIEIQIVLSEKGSMRYFVSQIEGTTDYIWESFIKCLKIQNGCEQLSVSK